MIRFFFFTFMIVLALAAIVIWASHSFEQRRAAEFERLDLAMRQYDGYAARPVASPSPSRIPQPPPK